MESNRCSTASGVASTSFLSYSMTAAAYARVLSISGLPCRDRNLPKQPLENNRLTGFPSLVSETRSLFWISNRRSQSLRSVNATESPSSKDAIPLVAALKERGSRHHEVPFHVPGHKVRDRISSCDLPGLHLAIRGAALPPYFASFLSTPLAFDLTELSGLDNLAAPAIGEPIYEAQALAAAAWGADQTFFLVNGSTVGIHAAILSTCSRSPLDALILPRNAHMSAFHGAILAGCSLLYIDPVFSHGLAHHVTPESMETAFAEAWASGLTPKAALLVSPTYFGVQSDIKAISEVCHKHGAALIVDEAHGAHLHFLSPPQSALDFGADVVIQSTHKTLGALTQGSMLHLNLQNDRIDADEVQRWLRMLQSSSPSYLILASLDASRAQALDFRSIAAVTTLSNRIRKFWDSSETSGSVCNKKIHALDILEESGAAVPRDGGSFSVQNELSPDPNLLRISKSGWRLLCNDTLMDSSSGQSSQKTKNIRSIGTPEYHHGLPTESHTTSFDPWRFTVLVPDELLLEGFSGWDVYKILEERKGIVPELACWNAVVFAAGVGTTEAHVDALIEACEWMWNGDEFIQILRSESFSPSLSERSSGQSRTTLQELKERFGSRPIARRHRSGPKTLSPREALRAPKEVVSIERAVGRVSGELFCPYPPGIPLIYPGEIIERETIDTLKGIASLGGGRVVGPKDASLQTVLVIRDDPY